MSSGCFTLHTISSILSVTRILVLAPLREGTKLFPLPSARSTKDSVSLAHGGFNIERSNVLPSFLQQTDQEVDACVQVLSDLVFVQLISSDGGGQAQHLLQLESHSTLNFLDL